MNERVQHSPTDKNGDLQELMDTLAYLGYADTALPAWLVDPAGLVEEFFRPPEDNGAGHTPAERTIKGFYAFLDEKFKESKPHEDKLKLKPEKSFNKDSLTEAFTASKLGVLQPAFVRALDWSDKPPYSPQEIHRHTVAARMLKTEFEQKTAIYKEAAAKKAEHVPEKLNEKWRDILREQAPYTFNDIFRTEIEDIVEARKALDIPPMVTSSNELHPVALAHEARLMGLAFSGGGIRSATFNLGVLQALAEFRLLRQFDYLSSVSGGGYIAAWLHRWIHDETHPDPKAAPTPTPKVFDAVEKGLCPNANNTPDHEGFRAEHERILRLRQFSNFLTPTRGPLGRETWEAAAIWLAGILLTGVVVTAFIVGYFALFRIFASLIESANLASLLPDTWQNDSTRSIVAFFGLPGILVILFMGLTIAEALRVLPGCVRRWLESARSSLLPVKIATAIPGVVLLVLPSLLAMPLEISIPSVLAWIGSLIAGVKAAGSGIKDSGRIPWRKFAARSLPYVFLTGILVAISAVYWSWIEPETTQIPEKNQTLEFSVNTEKGNSTHLTGPVTGTLVIARQTQADDRFAAYAAKQLNTLHAAPRIDFTIFGIAFRVPCRDITIFGIALMVFLLVPLFFDLDRFTLQRFYERRLKDAYLTPPEPPKNAQDPLRLADLKNKEKNKETVQRPYPLINTAINLTNPTKLEWQERRAHSFVFTPKHIGYQFTRNNRLIAAYTKTKDSKNPIDLATPIAISGAAASPNAGTRTRRDIAAVMTLLNVRLGKWFKNPGNYTPDNNKGMFAFIKSCLQKLSEIFHGWHQLWNLAKELLARTNEKDPEVYLSDGGHFDNTGLYELIRRRTRYIILSDAEEDPDFKFEGLSAAIRKCRVDFGVDIEIDTSPLIPDPSTGISRACCVVGVVHYETTDDARAHAPGYLLYLKASMIGHEPKDVQEYKRRNASFPHESTLADQWYGESQFESYRALGYHLMHTAIEPALMDERAERNRRNARNTTLRDIVGHYEHENEDGNPPATSTTQELCNREILFKSLSQLWHPFTPHRLDVAQLDATYQGLLREAASNKALAFLDHEFVSEWEQFTEIPAQSRKISNDELRQGFYFCCQLLRFMQSVYLSTDIERNHHTIENQRWINLFRHWSWSPTLRATWSIIASNFNPRFTQFCRRLLPLDIGRVRLGHAVRANDTEALEKRFNSLECQHIKEITDSLNKEITNSVANVLVIQIEIRVASHPKTKKPFHFPVGFAVVDGQFAIAGADDKSNRKLRYLRIRDHLRSMGLGRRALEALWREDCELTYQGIHGVETTIQEADCDRLGRLWHAMLSGVPAQQAKKAHESLYKLYKETPGKNSIRSAATCIGNWQKVLIHQPDNEEATRSIASTLKYLLSVIGKWQEVLKHQPDNEEATRSIASTLEYLQFLKKNSSTGPTFPDDAQKLLDVLFDDALTLLKAVLDDNDCSAISLYNRAALNAFRLRNGKADEKEVESGLTSIVEAIKDSEKYKRKMARDTDDTASRLTEIYNDLDSAASLNPQLREQIDRDKDFKP